ncbi:AMP-binding protein [Streptomyces sp. Wh19]|uniref:AMP-binding protein n=1 Tax=Streptomyces sp. Wh19 TaxID=3076629 RepID=UPI0029589EAE|nr:AMP-binding protein [Streptomyces sp. Wh19]MDV9194455.1 AMP-binding protein [Streptomyces sp. Wh19]
MVHLMAGPCVEAIAAYLACLRLGHAVIVTDSRLDTDHQNTVRACMRPDVVVDARGRHGPGTIPATAGYLTAPSLGTATVLVRQGDNYAIPVSDSVAVLLATSGSLDGSRFVCLSYRNVISNALAIGQALALSSEDRAALTLPLAHSYGLSVLNSHLLAGGSLAMPQIVPSSSRFWGVFGRLGCTTFAGVPDNYQILTALGVRFGAQPSLRLATVAGGALSERLVVEIAEDLLSTGKELAVMYGQTEATARIACHRGPDVLRYPTSVGAAVPGSTVWIESPDGSLQRDGDTGEILLRGPGIMLGYVRTRQDLATIPDNSPPTLRTGDRGHLSQGRLRITGRLSRLVKPLGVRVELDEIEAAFAAVGPAAVVAGEGETLMVYVERDPAAYRGVYRSVLANYALPPKAVRVVPITRIPRTYSGKVAYSALSPAGPTRSHVAELNHD